MIILISNPAPVKDEHEIIHQLFDEGLESFHVHKPFFSEDQLIDYIRQFGSVYRSKISLHSRHLKFHSIREFEECKEVYDYAFLSPIFNSISKTGFRSKFDLDEIKVLLNSRKENLIALGGIDEDKIGKIKELGFSGIALLGAIWQSDKPVEKFIKIKEKWMQEERAC